MRDDPRLPYGDALRAMTPSATFRLRTATYNDVNGAKVAYNTSVYRPSIRVGFNTSDNSHYNVQRRNNICRIVVGIRNTLVRNHSKKELADRPPADMRGMPHNILAGRLSADTPDNILEDSPAAGSILEDRPVVGILKNTLEGRPAADWLEARYQSNRHSAQHAHNH